MYHKRIAELETQKYDREVEVDFRELEVPRSHFTVSKRPLGSIVIIGGVLNITQINCPRFFYFSISLFLLYLLV